MPFLYRLVIRKWHGKVFVERCETGNQAVCIPSPGQYPDDQGAGDTDECDVQNGADATPYEIPPE